MASKQELKTILEENLSASGYLMRVHVEGNLDTEWGTLYIEYQRNLKQKEKDFKIVNQILKQKLESVIYDHFTSGIASQYEGPDDNEKYRAVFGRRPSEIMGEDSTEKFLEKANEQFRNRYWFKSEPKIS